MKYIHRHGTNNKPRVDFGVNQNGGLCYCDCGEFTPICKGTDRRFGLVKGEPVRYINGHHLMLPETYTVEDRGYDTPCWIWRNEKSEGYGYIQKNGKFIYAHAYFYKREYGPTPDGHQLHHKCEVKNCVRLSHIQLLSVTDHQRVHPRTKFSLEKAREARRLVSVCGFQLKDVAELMEVSRGVVGAAVRNKTWVE